LTSAIAEAHVVSRPDLVRIDQAGNPSEIATLFVGGLLFEDWETVWIQWSWGSDFSTFRFTCAEREPYPLPGQVLQFAPGNIVDIYLGGIQVIRGVIVTRQVAYDANQHMVRLEGVSYSWFASRSSIEHQTSDFDGKSFTQIADELLKPTGVKYQTVGDIDQTPFQSGASPQGGETIGQMLERLARDRKIIVSNMPNGDFLFIGEHSYPTLGELVEGVNIEKMQCVLTVEAARSEFLVRGQKKGNDTEWGRAAAEQEAKIKGILGPYSILLTAIEHPVWSSAEVAKRAETEKMWAEDVTKIEATVTVYGWFRPLPTTIESISHQQLGPTTGHTLWQAGDEVIVHSPMAMLYNQPLKIRTVTWKQDSQNGSQTELQCVNSQGLNGRGAPVPLPRATTSTSAPTTPPTAPETPPPTPPIIPAPSPHQMKRGRP
jgi:prophage tail gpP-like protein